ncbi:hypothetical protein Patl1_24755 [Pistacia atlantica]|uniref:Uncharacterized protein n=1 Tax=Pistacia atlantica TaxID=434234 RepID=A0ACC1B1Z9_9ROSI|nr:hypothetical protein Patl1_24755 [Pistacia atlantica]
MELTTIGNKMDSMYSKLGSRRDVGEDSPVDEELQLQWAAVERLPTFKRIRTSLFEVNHDNGGENNDQFEGKRVTDVTKLGGVERRLFIEKLIKHNENDNLRLLQRLKERIDRVNVKLPTVEVRYKNLFVETECEIVEGKPLPSLWNSFTSSFSVFKRVMSGKSHEAKLSILKDVNGIIRPSRLTLLLGPPGCGKTTLLLALAGKLDHSLKATGEITYNGYRLDEFVPQKTSAYISQYDLHIPEMTVRETIDFSARCQGVGTRADIMVEVSRREKEAGIVPDPDVDTYMKATSVEGQKRSLQTDYVLKILGLDICADVIAGSALTRGISGGQKKRLTTGEMIVGPTKALFMDEISTGLDSFHNLSDSYLSSAKGKIVYHGPCSQVLQHFGDCGFKCPERKGVADFLQQITSKKDQAQYWCQTDTPYNYVSVDQFSQMFKSSYLGKKLDDELLKPEVLLMKRNMFVYVFKTAQLVVTAFMTMTVFIRTEMKVDLLHANFLMGCMYYAIVRLLTNGVAELSLTIIRLPVVHKQRSFYLYPAWAYSIPSFDSKDPTFTG